jgi:putative hydrolase of the HAD superfamily
MSYRAVILDLYQTLLYGERTGTRELAAQAADAGGIPMDEWLAAWSSTLERSDRGEVATILERVHMALSVAGAEDAGPELADRLAGLLLASEYPLLYPDTRSALAELRRRGYRLALLSNFSAYRRDWLSEFALDRLLDSVVFSFEVGLLKPEAAIYEHAADRLGLPPRECLFVDDQPVCLRGAREVGMATVWIDRPERRDHPASDGSHDLRIEGLGELLDWLPQRAGEPMDGANTR